MIINDRREKVTCFTTPLFWKCRSCHGRQLAPSQPTCASCARKMLPWSTEPMPGYLQPRRSVREGIN